MKEPSSQTAVVFVSEKLRARHGQLVVNLQTSLTLHGIALQFLEKTNSIWVRDFMPIQRHDGKFVSYAYRPDYLRSGYKHLITNWRNVVPIPGEGSMVQCELVLDGGNVQLMGRSAIVTEKVFRENPSLSRVEVEKRLTESFELDHLIIIPNETGDIFGHSDGMVAWAASDCILMNDYRNLDPPFHRKLKRILTSARANVVEIPYSPSFSSSGQIPSAAGGYTNLLVFPKVVFMPIYGLNSDDAATEVVRKVFDGRPVIPLDMSKVAPEGGSLHCISWDRTIDRSCTSR